MKESNLHIILIKQDPQEHRGCLVFQVDRAKRETKEIRVKLVCRERQDLKETLDSLDFLYVIKLFSMTVNDTS